MKTAYPGSVWLSAFLLVLCAGLSGCASGGAGTGLRGMLGQRDVVDRELFKPNSPQDTLEYYRHQVADDSSSQRNEKPEFLPSWLGDRNASNSRSCAST